MNDSLFLIGMALSLTCTFGTLIGDHFVLPYFCGLWFMIWGGLQE